MKYLYSSPFHIIIHFYEVEYVVITRFLRLLFHSFITYGRMEDNTYPRKVMRKTFKVNTFIEDLIEGSCPCFCCSEDYCCPGSLDMNTLHFIFWRS